jgi:hypothetical protein
MPQMMNDAAQKYSFGASNQGLKKNKRIVGRLI